MFSFFFLLFSKNYQNVTNKNKNRFLQSVYGFDFDFLQFLRKNLPKFLQFLYFDQKKLLRPKNVGLQRQVFRFLQFCVNCFNTKIGHTNFLDN